MTRASAIYEGVVHHRRWESARHDFSYRLFMMYIDLEELPSLFDGIPLWDVERPALGSFWREDYHGDATVSLDTCVRETVRRETGEAPTGPIRMLTNLRYFCFCFNPVTFYYCFDASGEQVTSIVAEITNTPWHERHAYVLQPRDSQDPENRLRFEFGKAFHISPFMDMDIHYSWNFETPGDALGIHMENQRGGETIFDTTLALRRREITPRSAMGVLARYPLLTAKVVGGIYLQAGRLWRKRVPFHAHPDASSEDGASSHLASTSAGCPIETGSPSGTGSRELT